MLIAMILVCNMSIGASECTPKNASYVIRLEQTGVESCGLQAQAILAADHPRYFDSARGQPAYQKIVCGR